MMIYAGCSELAEKLGWSEALNSIYKSHNLESSDAKEPSSEDSAKEPEPGLVSEANHINTREQESNEDLDGKSLTASECILDVGSASRTRMARCGN